MTPRQWKPIGSVLQGDGNHAIGVDPDMDPVEALALLLDESLGVVVPTTNPILRAAAVNLKVERWWSSSKAQREAEGWDDETCTDWWSPGGDGKRSIYVLDHPESLYALEVRIADAEPAA